MEQVLAAPDARSLLSRLRPHFLDDMRIVVQVGTRGGVVPVAHTGNDVGFLLRRADEARAEGRRRWSGFTTGGPDLASLAAKGFESHDRALPGVEKKVGPRGFGNPVLEDVLWVPIPGLFGLVSIPANRGGLHGENSGVGLSIAPIPLPWGTLPFQWGTLTFYVSHRRVAPLARRVLDTSDRLGPPLYKATAPVRVPFRMLGKGIGRLTGDREMSGRFRDSAVGGAMSKAVNNPHLWWAVGLLQIPTYFVVPQLQDIEDEILSKLGAAKDAMFGLFGRLIP
jgi:hypothetical protein